MREVFSLLFVSGIMSLGTRPYLLTMSATPVNVPPSLNGLVEQPFHHFIVHRFVAGVDDALQEKIRFSSWSKKKG